MFILGKRCWIVKIKILREVLVPKRCWIVKKIVLRLFYDPASSIIKITPFWKGKGKGQPAGAGISFENYPMLGLTYLRLGKVRTHILGLIFGPC